MLAECDAKRRIAERYAATIVQLDDLATRGRHDLAKVLEGWTVGIGSAVRQMAEVYADHPDYDEAWRP